MVKELIQNRYRTGAMQLPSTMNKSLKFMEYLASI